MKDYTTNSHYLAYVHFSLQGWENVLFELGSARASQISSDSPQPNARHHGIQCFNRYKHTKLLSDDCRKSFGDLRITNGRSNRGCDAAGFPQTLIRSHTRRTPIFGWLSEVVRVSSDNKRKESRSRHRWVCSNFNPLPTELENARNSLTLSKSEL